MLDKDDQKREHSGLGMKMLLSGMAESRKSKDLAEREARLESECFVATRRP